MKIYNLKYTALIAALLIAVGCTDDNHPVKRPETQFRIDAVIKPLENITPTGEQPEDDPENAGATKSIGSKADGVNVPQLVWPERGMEAVTGLFYIPSENPQAGTYSLPLYYVSGNPSSTAASLGGYEKIEWYAGAGAHNFYSLTPYRESTSYDMDRYPVYVNTSQERIGLRELIGSSAILTGAATASSLGSYPDFELQTPLTLLNLRLDATGSCLQGQRFENARLTADKNIAGDAFFNFSQLTVSGGTSSTVEAVFTETLTLGQDTEIMFFVLPTLGDSDRIELSLENDSYKATVTFTIEADLIPNGYYELRINLQEEIDRNFEVEYTGTTYSDDGTANTVMVTPGGKVVIPVKKAWHVWSEYLQEDLGTENIETEFLWQDTPGLITAMSLSPGDTPQTSVITVQTAPGKTGNALVAVKVGGELRWSWQIWVTDYVPDNSAAYNNSVETFIFMDRNLGATTTRLGQIESFGYLYQWGRKDPFPGCNIIYSPAGDEIETWNLYDLDGNVIPEDDLSRPGSLIIEDNLSENNLRAAVVHPNRFYSNGFGQVWGNGWYYVGDWLTWTFEKQNEYLWNTPSGGKSVFDPCPEGWRVPNSSVTAEGYYSPWHFIEGENSEYGIITDIGTYPACGFRASDRGDLTHAGLTGYLWSANTFYGKHHFTEQTVQNTMATVIWPRNGISNGGTPLKAHGLSVRCAKE